MGIMSHIDVKYMKRDGMNKYCGKILIFYMK